jgi:basic amino acid/polyamine antiporter, APA family
MQVLEPGSKTHAATGSHADDCRCGPGERLRERPFGPPYCEPIGAEAGHGDVLKRAIGPGMLLFLVVGDILGAGIYARVGAVAGQVGGAIWVAFLVGLVVAALTALSYVELVTKYPGAGGAALYVDRAWGMPFLTFMVAFTVMVSGISSSAAVARAFGGDYLRAFVDLPALPVAIVFIIAVALINFRGISESVGVNLVLTLVELSGLLLIVLIGAMVLLGGGGDPGRAVSFKADVNLPLALLSGAVIAFYAFLGFEDAVNLAEECKEPSRNFPKALLLGLAAAGLVYVLVSMTAAMVVEPETLAASSGPLLEVVERGPVPVPGWLFAGIALMAITNTALLNMVMASRVLFGMARQGIVPRIFGATHSGRRTPWVAIVFTTLIALGLVTTGNLGALANTTVFLLLVIFVLVNAAVLILRRDPVPHEHFSVPTFVPVLGGITGLLLLTRTEPDVMIRAGVLLAVGVGLWVVNRLAHRRDAAAA